MEEKSRNVGLVIKVFVPFLGDFLSIALNAKLDALMAMRFRPLSWGLSFNESYETLLCREEQFSSPFLGTFFQWKQNETLLRRIQRVFVPFLGDFLSI